MRTLYLAQAALAVSLAVGGCATTQPDAATLTTPETPDLGAPYMQPGATVSVAVADTARIPLGEAVAMDGVSVRFARVTEDSRCPPGVTCVWAGRARVELVIGSETHVLAVPGYGPDDQPTEVMVGGLTVRVVRLAERLEESAGSVAPVWVELVAERS